MMDAVRQDPVPEDGANRRLLPVEERQRAIEILRLKLLDSSHRIFVNAFEPWSQRVDGARAFEIGRLLALSQLSVVSALLRFRSEQFGAGRIRELLSHIVGFELPSIAEQRVDLGRLVAVSVVSGLAKNPGQTIGPRRPVADPGRELVLSPDLELDQVIAEGLGLNLGAVRKLSDQIGVVAALSRSTVPVAKPVQDVTALRVALNQELQSVIAVAAPPQILTTGRRASRDAAPARDALDELIDRAVDPGEDEESE